MSLDGLRRLDQRFGCVSDAKPFEEELPRITPWRSRMKVPGLGTPTALPRAASSPTAGGPGFLTTVAKWAGAAIAIGAQSVL